MVTGIQCSNDQCNFAQHPVMSDQLLQVSSDYDYIHQWAVRHMMDCSGPLVVNKIDGETVIFTPGSEKKYMVGK